MHPRLVAGAVLASALLAAGCAGVPAAPDMTTCEAQATRDLPEEVDPRRLPAIDACMTAKGWKPSKVCVELNMQGSRFCDYLR